MAISRSIRVTYVALEIRRIDVLFVDSSVCHIGVGYQQTGRLFYGSPTSHVSTAQCTPDRDLDTPTVPPHI